MMGHRNGYMHGNLAPQPLNHPKQNQNQRDQKPRLLQLKAPSHRHACLPQARHDPRHDDKPQHNPPRVHHAVQSGLPCLFTPQMGDGKGF